MPSVRIRQYAFPVPDRFVEGHPLSEGEAQALNVLRSENIRNNMSKAVLAAIDSCEGDLLSGEALEALQAKFDHYARNYQFLPRHSPKGQGEGELEREVRAVASEHFQQSFGRSPEGGEHLSLLSDPEIQARARERLAARSQVANSTLAGLL